MPAGRAHLPRGPVDDLGTEPVPAPIATNNEAVHVARVVGALTQIITSLHIDATVATTAPASSATKSSPFSIPRVATARESAAGQLASPIDAVHADASASNASTRRRRRARAGGS